MFVMAICKYIFKIAVTVSQQQYKTNITMNVLKVSEH